MADKQSVYEAISRERDYQDRKRGTIEERQLNIATYLQIAQRELNEAMFAIDAGEEDNARCEALQVAATVVACLERHGIVERPLNRLQEAIYDDDDESHCSVCEDEGACRDWVECMADDAGVPVEWLAQRVLDGVIGWDWEVIQVQVAYAELEL